MNHVSAAHRSSRHDAVPVEVRLNHVAIIGGSSSDWDQLTEAQWQERLTDLGKVADNYGAAHLTIRPYLADAASTAITAIAASTADVFDPQRALHVGNCTVATFPVGSGRDRVIAALQTLAARNQQPTEAAIVEVMNQPATSDPDLAVVLGPRHRMPATLVWELAYCELVFVETSWLDLHAAHLDQAIGAFASRHRRFGGID